MNTHSDTTASSSGSIQYGEMLSSFICVIQPANLYPEPGNLAGCLYEYPEETVSWAGEETWKEYLHLFCSGSPTITKPARYQITPAPMDAAILLAIEKGEAQLDCQGHSFTIPAGSFVLLPAVTSFSVLLTLLPCTHTFFVFGGMGLSLYKPWLPQASAKVTMAEYIHPVPETPLSSHALSVLQNLPETVDPASLLQMHSCLTQLLTSCLLQSMESNPRHSATQSYMKHAARAAVIASVHAAAVSAASSSHPAAVPATIDQSAAAQVTAVHAEAVRATANHTLETLTAADHPAAPTTAFQPATNQAAAARTTAARSSPQTPHELPRYLIYLHAAIHTQYQEPFSLSFYERQLNVSRYRLCREYSRTFGISPLQDLNRTRIRKARELLAYSDAQVQEIAAMTGFENTNHFITLFKRETGMTPGAYRKMMTEGQANCHPPTS